MRHKRRHFKSIDDPISTRALFELSLFSAFIFVLSALLMQFLLNFYISLLLRLYRFEFHYSLFKLFFFEEGSIDWSKAKTLLIFGSGPFLTTAFGFFLLFTLRSLKRAGWKLKLILTWLAYMTINALPCSIIAGAFFYESFGIAERWVFTSAIFRIIIAMVIFIILIISNAFWRQLFLKTSYSTAFFEHEDERNIFLKTIFLKPWFYGFIILMLFNFPIENKWFWPAFLFCLGYLALPVQVFEISKTKPRIKKSDKQIFSNWLHVLFLIIFLALVWIVDYHFFKR